MNKLILLSIILYSFIFSNALSNTNEKIVYIDMDKIMKISKAGKKVIDKINKQKKNDISKFQKIEKDLKSNEDELVKKKNVLSDEEFNKELTNLRKKIDEYRSLRQKSVETSTKKRLNASADFALKIKPILAEYASNNGIDMVIQKKNIIMGKSELDITDEILIIVDKKITKLKTD